MKRDRLESTQRYAFEGKYLNPPDHPIELASKQEVDMRGDCDWFDGKYCLNKDVFEQPEVVNGGYCSTCEDWEPKL